MRTETIELYTFEELSEEAKEAAREWYRDGGLDYKWWDSVYDCAKEVGAALGIDIDRIYFSGFWSQGDGASFEGTYRYRKGWRQALRKYVGGEDLAVLEDIGERLQAAQRRAAFQILATARQRGHYMSHQWVEVDLGDPPNGEDWPTLGRAPHLWYDPVDQALQEFAHWIYKSLEREYEYLNSDEVVDDMLTLNEYEFTEDGNPA